MKDTHNTIENTLDAAAPVLESAERLSLWRAIAAQLEPVPSPAPVAVSRFFSFGFRPAYALLLIFILIVSAGGTAYASDAARPGDTLFPIERAVERARLTFATDGAWREEFQNRLAKERVDELRELVAEGRVADSLSSGGEERVGVAVQEILLFLDETKTKDERRDEVLKEVFTEIDPYFITIEVEENIPTKKEVRVRKSDLDESIIDIRAGEKFTRIERKDGEVRVRVKHDSEEFDDANEGDHEARLFETPKPDDDATDSIDDKNSGSNENYEGDNDRSRGRDRTGNRGEREDNDDDGEDE